MGTRLAGRGGFIAGICDLLAVIGLVKGMSKLGFVMILFGLDWVIAAGFMLIWRK